MANRLDRIRWRQLFLAKVNRTLGSQFARDTKYLAKQAHATREIYVVLKAMRRYKRDTHVTLVVL